MLLQDLFYVAACVRGLRDRIRMEDHWMLSPVADWRERVWMALVDLDLGGLTDTFDPDVWIDTVMPVVLAYSEDVCEFANWTAPGMAGCDTFVGNMVSGRSLWYCTSEGTLMARYGVEGDEYSSYDLGDMMRACGRPSSTTAEALEALAMLLAVEGLRCNRCYSTLERCAC